MGELVQMADGIRQSSAFQGLSPPLQTALFLGALTFLPALLVSVTAYTRIVIVLAFVRQAVGTQQSPPNMTVIGLALFLTLFVMGPTLAEINEQSVIPYLNEKATGAEASARGAAALQGFMLRQTRRQDLALFIYLAKAEPPQQPEDTPLRILVPAYMISELKTAFVMGFCLYVPFLLVDLVVASVLTALGMVTLPPVLISTPFKLLLFVLADGWHLVVRALSLSFG